MTVISIIIPVLNESLTLGESLNRLQLFRQQGHEIIVVDGGSDDETLSIAEKYSDVVMVSKKGRAQQMNVGAQNAKGDILLFLHADTRLPSDACALIQSHISKNKQWGRFNVRLSGNRFAFRVIEFFINLRSKFSSVATGDQAIFVSKQLFNSIKGFPNIPLMEDVALCKILRQLSSPICLNDVVITSSRRWEDHGVITVVLLMWRLRFLYFIGVSPKRLVRFYHS